MKYYPIFESTWRWKVGSLPISCAMGSFSEKTRFRESLCFVSLEEGNFRIEQKEECCLIH